MYKSYDQLINALLPFINVRCMYHRWRWSIFVRKYYNNNKKKVIDRPVYPNIVNIIIRGNNQAVVSSPSPIFLL